MTSRARRLAALTALAILAGCEQAPVPGSPPAPPPIAPAAPAPDPEPAPAWIPDQPIRFALRAGGGYPVAPDQWARIVEYAQAAFDRSYIRLELPDRAGVTVHVRFLQTGPESMVASASFDRIAGVMAPTIEFYMPSFRRNYSVGLGVAPGSDEWLMGLGHILAHELMHVIDITCPHSPDQASLFNDHTLGGVWSGAPAVRFLDHARACISDLARPPGTQPR